MKVGTGLARGHQATPELAAEAVRQALDHAELEIANSVLLFLSRDFAGNPQPALQAAAKEASTIQVSGCSSHGIFTEEEWVLDVPAAAAMVLGDGVALSGARQAGDLLLTLTAPNALNATWMHLSGARFGGVAGDATGRGQFSVWENGKGASRGYCELGLHGAVGEVVAAHSVKRIGAPQRIEKVNGHDVMLLSSQTAWASLNNTLDIHGVDVAAGAPYHRLMVMLAEDEPALLRGDYQLASIIGADAASQSVTLAKEIATGSWLAWGILDAEAAQQNLLTQIESASGRLPGHPAFGLMFSCLARGPHLYDGIDRDIALLKHCYPGMPVIGFYGNGEIAPVHGRNELLQHSVVLALFAAES
ncbi:FIST C-terminal domain-containing protein [Methylobacillus arboreus]|uniref:FIST C-terminal domain-containing protein n=1 Tax=Methylobacillus arboreus TaxID=755170 RepID=UPI001E3D5C9A|nr:FIST C-terminal domain-containing protein [Methylobacillus arboreus]MCB5191670.1 FIST C-terminal domain-containing protein [Methylobacillus arboreus]